MTTTITTATKPKPAPLALNECPCCRSILTFTTTGAYCGCGYAETGPAEFYAAVVASMGRTL